jgi:hypothetical protein
VASFLFNVLQSTIGLDRKDLKSYQNLQQLCACRKNPRN